MSGKIIVFIFANMDSLPAPLLLTFWQHIKPFDVWLITHINQDWGNGFLDTILPFFRESVFWVPLYLFLFLYVWMNCGAKVWWWLLAGVLTAALSDIISSQIIKENVMRLRPCQDPDVSAQLRFFIKYCPGSSSFTSSHATSYFAQASFFFLTLKHILPGSKWFFLWAGIIAYTQVYVGVHYPFDVFCGGLLGTGIGYLMARMFHKHSGMLSLVKY